VSILGTRVLRTEDPRFLTTGGVYTEDVTDELLAGACHVSSSAPPSRTPPSAASMSVPRWRRLA
jgi:hypothetical protein